MKKPFLDTDFFKPNEPARLYETNVGGVTRAISRWIVDDYIRKHGSLDGSLVLDNACGTGAATKELLAQSEGVKIEAADYSEAMVNALKDFNEHAGVGNQVAAQVLDAQVRSCQHY
jgi:ubiquinone/menaquinone biosynthesis C-methylase UbiE